MHTGSCLCRAVRFEIHGDLAPIQVCHCSQCRKAQGSAFATNIPVPSADFQFLGEVTSLRAFESSPGKIRVFCGDCGSPIFSQRPDTPDVLRLRAGTLDEPVEAKLGFHFHAGSKASWWEITDTLPRYPGPKPD
jgi:hypothetical protein